MATRKSAKKPAAKTRAKPKAKTSAADKKDKAPLGPKNPVGFQKGVSGNPAGRPKGTRNKLTADVKMMVEGALERAGKNVQKKRRSFKDLEPGTAYLADQAEKNPVAFMSLVGKIIPQKVDLDVAVMSRNMVTLLQERRSQLSNLKDVTPDGDTVDGKAA